MSRPAMDLSQLDICDQTGFRFTSSRICAKCKSQCIRATLWYSLWVVLLLPGFRFGNLLLIQVSFVQFFMEGLQRQSLDDIDWINNISQRLTHFTAVGVANHGVA